MKAIRHWFTKLAKFRIVTLRRKWVLSGALVAIGLAAFFGFFSEPEDRAALAAAVRDPLSVLESRSPGPRLSGALFQTKRRVAATRRSRPSVPPALPPHERVLAMTRSRPAAPPVVGPLDPAAPDLALLGQPSGLSVPGVPILGGAPAFDVPAFTFGNTPGFAITPSNPATPGTPGAPGTTNPESPGAAVPEPATWLMLMLGVGMIGHALRRRNAVSPSVAGR